MSKPIPIGQIDEALKITAVLVRVDTKPHCGYKEDSVIQALDCAFDLV
jgi:hypothetical protein